MKNFSVSISNLDSVLEFRKLTNLNILAKGKLNCGNEFQISTTFNLDGEITYFSLSNLDNSTLDFYNEIGEATKKIKAIQSNLNSILEKIQNEKQNYNNEISQINKEVSNKDTDIKNLEKEIDEITKQYKKSRGQNRANIEINLNSKKKELFDKIGEAEDLHDKINEILKRYISKINNDLNSNI